MHPCPCGAAGNSENYSWTFELFFWFCKEYEKRYNEIYKSFEIAKYFENNPCPTGGMTERSPCMPDEYKTDDLVESYRNYYLGEKLEFSECKFIEAPISVKKAEGSP